MHSSKIQKKTITFTIKNNEYIWLKPYMCTVMWLHKEILTIKKNKITN